jgi:NADH-quinone oxidoreductase subunit F
MGPVSLAVAQDTAAEHAEVNQKLRANLDGKTLGAVADALGLSDARVFGVASFYTLLSTRPRAAKVVRLCDGPVCMLRGAGAARAAVEAAAGGWAVERCSCLGLCDRAPAALVGMEPCGPIPADRPGEILAGRRGVRPSYATPLPGEVRRAMARIGRIDPDSLDSSLEAGAYQALATALAQDPARVLETVERSGLRGCGGAGFPTGRKWRLVAAAPGPQKFVVANADESEPGSFKDRVLLEGDPHLLLEGLALAGYAVGAEMGIVYVRGEYEGLARQLERAVAQAEERGWLGAGVRGSRFAFRVRVHRGAGAYVCGEETALLESLEGKRGEPRTRPPYPAACGLFGRPTVVNNVETLCHVPALVARGADWFRTLGTASSPGTKLFTVTGCVNRPGVFEAPLGITLRQVVEQFGGGMRGGRFKATLAGGAAGMFVPAKLLDVPIDFASGRLGVPLGCGAMIILDEAVPIPTLLTWPRGRSWCCRRSFRARRRNSRTSCCRACRSRRSPGRSRTRSGACSWSAGRSRRWGRRGRTGRSPPSWRAGCWPWRAARRSVRGPAGTTATPRVAVHGADWPRPGVTRRPPR